MRTFIELIRRVDRTLLRAAGRARSPRRNLVARGVTSLGSVPGELMVALGAAGLVRRSPRLASQIAVGAMGGVLAELVIKRFFRRKRPTLLPHLEIVRSTSFPSGHAMAASALYLTLGFVAGRRIAAHRGPLLAGGGALAATIGATRVYLGVHWPSDVAAGLALGAAWASGIDLAFHRPPTHAKETCDT